jgi:hypothetical protein
MPRVSRCAASSWVPPGVGGTGAEGSSRAGA